MPLPIQPTSSPQPMSVKNSAHLLAPTSRQTMTSPWKEGDKESWLFCDYEKLLLPSYDMRTEVKRCRHGRNFAVFVLNATPRKKFVPRLGKNLRHFLPGEAADHFWRVNSAQTQSCQREQKLSTEETHHREQVMRIIEIPFCVAHTYEIHNTQIRVM